MAADAQSPALPDRPRGSRWDYALPVSTAMVAMLAVVTQMPTAVAVAVIVAAIAALQWFVQRRGGWRLVGPHAYYDLIRLSRRGRIVLLRTLFLCVVVAAIYCAYEQYRLDREPGAPHWLDSLLLRKRSVATPPPTRVGLVDWQLAPRTRLRQQMARLNVNCVYIWFLLQNIAILLLTPAYLGGALAEERERGTLGMLLATRLYNREIVLGKLFARVLHLGTFLLAPLPIFSIMLVWGGLDVQLLVAGWINSVLFLLAVSSACLMLSTLPVRASTAITLSYLVMVPASGCGLQWAYRGLQEAVLSASWTKTETLVELALEYGIVIPGCILVAIAAIRARAYFTEHGAIILCDLRKQPALPSVPVSEEPVPLVPPMLPPSVARELPGDKVRIPLRPPVHDDAIYWKERYTGAGILPWTPPVYGVLCVGVMFVAFLLLLGAATSVVERQPATVREALRILAEKCAPAVQALYAVALVCYCIGVAFRAAGCVVRERQMHTLDMLLQLPIERREILRAKWRAALLRGWPWLALLVADLTLGQLIGVYHPLSFVFMLVFPLPLLAAVCCIGLLISTSARTTARANLAMACILLAIAVCCAVTKPGLFVGYSAFTETWFQPLRIDTSDVEAAGVSTLLLLCIAGAACALAGRLFERLGR